MQEAESWGYSEGTHVPSDPHSPVGPESVPVPLSPRGLRGGRMGLQSPAAYLGGLKEYCMCPQELRSERQCAQRGRRKRQRQEKDAKCKNRLEMAWHPICSPRQPEQTAGHTPAGPAEDQGTHTLGSGDLDNCRPVAALAPRPLTSWAASQGQEGPGDVCLLMCQPWEVIRLALRCQPPRKGQLCETH